MSETKKFDENVYPKGLITKGEGIGEIIAGLVSVLMIQNWGVILDFAIRVGLPDGVPLPSASIIAEFSVWLIGLAGIGILLGVLKYASRRWTYILATVHTVHSLLNAALFVLMATSGTLLRPETISAWADTSGRTTTQVSIGAYTALTILALFVVIVSVGDTVYRWVQASHQDSPPGRGAYPGAQNR